MTATQELIDYTVKRVARAQNRIPDSDTTAQEALAQAMTFLGRAVVAAEDGEDEAGQYSQDLAEFAEAATTWAGVALKRAGHPDPVAVLAGTDRFAGM